METLEKSDLATYKRYLAKQLILLVDRNASSRRRIEKILKETLEVANDRVISCDNFEDAVAQMTKKMPTVVICDYFLDKKSAFDLHLKYRGLKIPNGFFTIVSANTSQVVVSKCAEEEIDCFILKPYSIEIFVSQFVREGMAKAYPNEYRALINQGISYFEKGDYSEALATLQRARRGHRRPALAHYHIAQIYFKQNLPDAAVAELQKGILCNRIHFRCLNGLFEYFLRQKDFVRAYEVCRNIAHFYPAQPKRLVSLVYLAIVTQNMEDIKSYYNDFMSMDLRLPELRSYVTASLVITGKYFLQAGQYEKTFDLYDKASAVANDKPHFLQAMIENLVCFGHHLQAKSVLVRFLPEHQSGPEFNVSQFLTLSESKNAEALLSEGLLLYEKAPCASLARLVIASAIKLGKIELTQKVLSDVSKRWPDLLAELSALLKGASHLNSADEAQILISSLDKKTA